MWKHEPTEYVDISTIGIDDVPHTPAPLPSSSDKATISYWMATTPHHSLPASIDYLPEKTDVLIIGSGITGVSTAYHLVNAVPPSLPFTPSISKITIIEARSFCSGATGRNGGHLTAASALAYTDIAANPNHLLGDRISSLQADGIKSESAKAVEEILTFEANTANAIRSIIAQEHAEEQVGFTDNTNWHVCVEQAEVDEFEHSLAQAAKHDGLQSFVQCVRRVPKDEVDQRMNNPTGIVAVYEIPGATLHPRKLVNVIYKRAQAIAASKNIVLNLVTDLPVLKVSSQNQEYSIASTSKGDIRAKYVVHATNGYASHLLPHLRSSDGGIIPTRAQVVAVTPLLSQSHLWGMGLSAGGGYEYGHQRPLTDSSSPPYIMGGGREYATGREWGVADDTLLNPQVSAFLHPYLKKMFPESYGDDLESEWTGIMGYTKTKDPLVGPVPWPEKEQEGESKRSAKEYIAAGYSGHGMTRAFGCAEAVAEMIWADVMGKRWETKWPFPECYLTAPARAQWNAVKVQVQPSPTKMQQVNSQTSTCASTDAPRASKEAKCSVSSSKPPSTGTYAGCCIVT